jgi:hypothetical protein
MPKLKILLFFIFLPLLSFTVLHKYYVSLTEIEYVKEEQSVQIITRIYIDDFESALRNRYEADLTLQSKYENLETDYYIEKYLKDKLKITINDKLLRFNFLGKEYEDDMVLCYMEIPNIESVSSIEVVNKILYDLFPDQKNIVRIKINTINKSILLIKENDKGLLNLE